MDCAISLDSRGLPLAPHTPPVGGPRMNARGSFRGDAYVAVHPSTPDTRAAQAARRAHLYPLPDGRLAALQSSIRHRIGGAVTTSREAVDALVLDMARVALRWSPDEVEARNLATG